MSVSVGGLFGQLGVTGASPFERTAVQGVYTVLSEVLTMIAATAESSGIKVYEWVRRALVRAAKRVVK